MNRLHDAWRPLLLGLVLLSVLVGVAGAVPTDQPSALSTRRQLAIAAADFYPGNSSANYGNNGKTLWTWTATDELFLAQVDFPAPLWVTIDKFELFACDNNASQSITAELYLSKPSEGTEQEMVALDTGDGYANALLQTWQDTSISPNVKNPANDVYVQVWIEDSAGLALYGVRIYYYIGR